MVFILLFVNVVYHIDLQILKNPCILGISHLIIMDDPFNVLLDSVWQDSVEKFCVYVHP